MAKLKKDYASLYCGTTERVAKLAPVLGINPSREPVYLSDVYPGLLAFFASTQGNDRFGIIEVETSFLDSTNFLPCEWFLDQISRQKVKTTREHTRRLESFKKNLEKYRSKWRDSLLKTGVVVYEGFIPKKAIRRISIYDPASNTMITNEIINERIGPADYKRNRRLYQNLTRWLMGETIAVEEWMGENWMDFPKEEREQLAEHLQNKTGLDIFYHEPPGKGT
jgi:hypothetical protein